MLIANFYWKATWQWHLPCKDGKSADVQRKDGGWAGWTEQHLLSWKSQYPAEVIRIIFTLFTSDTGATDRNLVPGPSGSRWFEDLLPKYTTTSNDGQSKCKPENSVLGWMQWGLLGHRGMWHKGSMAWIKLWFLVYELNKIQKVTEITWIKIVQFHLSIYTVVSYHHVSGSMHLRMILIQIWRVSRNALKRPTLFLLHPMGSPHP